MHVLFYRFKIWLKRSGNRTILKHSPSYVSKNFLLCSNHFLPSDVIKVTKRHKLKPDAVPKNVECDCLSDKEISDYMSEFALVTGNIGFEMFIFGE
jgi:hypothetical protein